MSKFSRFLVLATLGVTLFGLVSCSSDSSAPASTQSESSTAALTATPVP